jgi:hypothetical protein
LVHQDQTSLNINASMTETSNLVRLSAQLVAHVSTLPTQMGHTLRNLHFSTAHATLDSIRCALYNVIAKIENRRLPELQSRNVLVMDEKLHTVDTGVVWNWADVLESLPRSPSGAVLLKWKEISSLLEDVVNEIKVSIREAEEDDDERTSIIGSDDPCQYSVRSGNLTNDLRLELRYENLALMQLLLKLMQLGYLFSKKCCSFLALASGNSALIPAEQAASLDQLATVAKQLEIHADEIGVACADVSLLRDPQLRADIQGYMNCWEVIIAVPPNSDHLPWIPHNEAATSWSLQANVLLQKMKILLDPHFSLRSCR